MASLPAPGRSRVADHLRGTPTVFGLLTADAANLTMFVFGCVCVGVGIALVAGIGPYPPLLLPFGVSAALLAIVALRIRSIVRFFRSATPVAGRVTEIKNSEYRRGGPDEVYYEYEFAGCSYTGMKHFSVHDLKDDQEISVYVDPANPGCSRVLEAYTRPISRGRRR